MNRSKLLAVAVLATVVFAACAAPAAQPTTPAPQPTVAAAQATPPATVQPMMTQPAAQSAQPMVKTADDPKLGTFLADAKGMTLYLYTKDEPNVSNCYDQCAQNWPPLLAGAGEPSLAGGIPGNLGVITRKDGSKQVTYNGTPLYYWVKDTKPGETTGQGVNDVWFVVQPAAQ